MLRKGIAALVVFSVILFAGLDGGIHSAWPHGKREGYVSPETLNQRIGKIKILDVRPEKEYVKGHIETALSIPLEELSQSRLNLLGFKKGQQIVVYGNSELSGKRAKSLMELLGYVKVAALAGGFVHWEEDGMEIVTGKMTAPFTQEEKADLSAIILEPEEFDFGVVPKGKGVVKTIFSLMNNGEAEVRLEEITTSCGCTSAKTSKNSISPGESIPMEVIFDPNFHKEPSGRFSRTVFVQTSEGMEVEAKIYVQIQD